MGNKLYTQIFISLLLLFLSSACNQEVFVDKLEPVANRLHLRGEGDTAIIRFSTTDWVVAQVVLNTPNYDDLRCSQYDENDCLVGTGIRLSHVWMGGKGRIVCENQSVELTIKRVCDKELEVIVGANLLQTDLKIDIQLCDPYMNVPLTFTQSVSSGYVLDSIVYTFLPETYSTDLEEKSGLIVNNNSSGPIPFSFSIFSGERTIVYFESDNPMAFSYLKELDNKVVYPSMLVDSVLVMGNDKITFESQPQWCALPFDDVIKIVQIPVGSRKISRLLEYEQYDARFSLYVKDTKRGVQKCITGIFHTKTPTGKYYVSLRKPEE